MSEKMFEVATRTKMRFPFKGQISVEDLWDLSVTNLDSVFKTLNAQVKQAKEESLLATKSQEDKLLEMQIEIVKYIVKVKQEEEIARLQAKELKEKKQKIMAVLSAKEDQALQNMSVEELKSMLGEI
jgi:polyphosphate kinase 2 (PPK2 family)